MPRKIQLPTGQSDRPILVVTARKNDAYCKICSIAISRLNEQGYFRIDKIIEDANMHGMDFYWSALEKMIEKDFGEEILPVTETFFKRKPAGMPPEDWAKKCSVNAGRRIKAGYVAFRDISAPVVKHVLSTHRNSAMGSVRRADAELQLAKRQIKPENIPYTPLIPGLMISADREG